MMSLNFIFQMDMTGEIWVETKSPEGKPYYYHARTRETTWTKPEGPNIKIFTQEQVKHNIINIPQNLFH